MFTEKVVLKPHDVSVFTTLSVNGRLFACPRDQFDSLVRMYVCRSQKVQCFSLFKHLALFVLAMLLVEASGNIHNKGLATVLWNEP